MWLQQANFIVCELYFKKIVKKKNKTVELLKIFKKKSKAIHLSFINIFQQFPLGSKYKESESEVTRLCPTL